MILRNLFRAVPFTCISLLAPEGNGGGSSVVQFENPAWAPSDKAPEVEGDSIENKLESSTGIIGKMFASLGNALVDFKKLWNEKQQLSTQFDELTDSFQKEKDAHGATKDLLETEKGAHKTTKDDLQKSAKSVERLEKLCDLKGLDKNEAVTPSTTAPGSDMVSQYKQLLADEKEGKVKPGAAHKFYRKNKKAIDQSDAAE